MLVRSQLHAAGLQLIKGDRILCEQLKAERQALGTFEKIRAVLQVQKSGLRQLFRNTAGLLLFEFYIIVGIVIPRHDRAVKSGMSAYEEGHDLLLLKIIHRKFLNDRMTIQCICNSQFCRKGKLLCHLIITHDRHRDRMSGLLLTAKFFASHDPVSFHLCFLIVSDNRLIIADTAADREQQRCLICPVCGISLPQILQALFALNGCQHTPCR